MSHALTDAQVAGYWRDGVVTGIPALSPSFVAGALRDLERRIDAAGGDAWTARDYRPWEHGEDHPLVGWMDAIARQRSVLEVVSSVLGPDLLIRNADVFWKRAGQVASITWHRDTAVTGPEADHLLNAWIGLSPSTPTNGGLRFKRGSHRLALTDPPRDNRSLNLSAAALRDVAPLEEIVHDMPVGHLSLHHFGTVHASGPNRSDAPRIGFVVRFMRPAVSRDAAESGTATRVLGRDPYGHFTLTRRFPLSWVA